MSDTSLGSLVVSLTASTAEFNTNLLDASRRADSSASQIIDSLKGINGQFDALIAGASKVASAFSGLAIGAGIAGGLAAVGTAVAEMAIHTADATNELKTLAAQAGTTRDSMLAFKTIGDEAGIGADIFARFLSKLNEQMAVAQDSTSKQAFAFRQLGVEATTANGAFRDTGSVMLDVLGSVSRLRDEQSKIAALTDIFGARQARELLPLLGDINSNYDRIQRVIAETGAGPSQKLTDDAVAWQRSTADLSLAWKGVSNAISDLVLPKMTTFIDQITAALIKVQQLPSAFKGVSDFFKPVTDFIAAWDARIQSGFPVIQKPFDAVLGHPAGDFADIPGAGSQGAIFDPDAAKKAAAAIAAAKAELASYTGELNHLQDALAKLTGSDGGFANYNAVIELINNKQREGAPLTAAHAAALLNEAAVLDQANADVRLNTALTADNAEAVKRNEEADKALSAAVYAQDQVIQTAAASTQALTDSLQDQINKSNDELNVLGLSSTALKQLAEDQKIDIELRKQIAKLDADEAQAKKTLSGANLQAALDAIEADKQRATSAAATAKDIINANIAAQDSFASGWQKAWQAFEDGATQAKAAQDLFNSLSQSMETLFVNAMNHSANAFKTFANSILQTIEQLLAKQAVQSLFGLLFNQGGGGLSALGVAGQAAGGAASGAGGLFNLFGSGNSLSTLFGTGSGLLGLPSLGASAANLGIVGSSIGSDIGLAGGIDAIGGATTALASAASLAIPVIGWIGAAVALFSAFSNKSPTPVSGQFGVQGGTSGFEDNAFTGSQFGNLGFLDAGTREFSGQAGQAFNQQVAGLLGLFAARESPAQIAQTAGALQTQQFPQFSGTFTTEDFIKQYGSKVLQQVATTAFDVLDPALGQVVESFKGTGDQLTQFIGSLLTFHDVVNTLPSTVKASLEGMLDGTQETLTKATAFAIDFAAIQNILNSDPLEDARKQVAQQNATLYDSFQSQGTALLALSNNFDGSTAAANNLVTATQSYYNAQVQLLAQIQQVTAAIDAMFGDTIRNITLQTLDNSGKQQFYEREIERLQGEALASKDPTVIQRDEARINQDTQSLFNLYSPADQQRLLGTFTTDLETVNARIDQHLSDLGTTITNDANSILTQINKAFTDAITKMGAAADKQNDAANTMNNAANTDLTASQNNLVASQTPIEVDVRVTPQYMESNG